MPPRQGRDPPSRPRGRPGQHGNRGRLGRPHSPDRLTAARRVGYGGNEEGCTCSIVPEWWMVFTAPKRTGYPRHRKPSAVFVPPSGCPLRRDTNRSARRPSRKVHVRLNGCAGGWSARSVLSAARRAGELCNHSQARGVCGQHPGNGHPATRTPCRPQAVEAQLHHAPAATRQDVASPPAPSQRPAGAQAPTQ